MNLESLKANLREVETRTAARVGVVLLIGGLLAACSRPPSAGVSNSGHFVANDAPPQPVAAHAATVPRPLDGSPTQRVDHSAAALALSTDIIESNGVWSWHPASLAWNCWTNALASTNALRGNFSNLFTTFSPTDRRNPDFWFRHFKGWPACSVWNNGETNLWPQHGVRASKVGVTYQSHGVLVTPEHVLTAGHVGFDTNTWLAFMDLSNRVVFRRIKDFFFNKPGGVGPNHRNNLTTNLPGPPWGEFYLGLLDRPVPDSIGFARIVPTNWLAWFDAPFLNSSPGNPRYPVPLYLLTCQHRTPELQDLTFLQCDSTNRLLYFHARTLTNLSGHDFRVGGDSGSPRFLVLDGELCLARIEASNLSFIGGRGLYDPAYQQACLNAAMRELSLRNRHTNLYTLTVKDLSRYPRFGRSYDCPP